MKHAWAVLVSEQPTVLCQRAMRTLSFGSFALLLLVSGCRSDIPSDSTLCWNSSSGQASADPQYAGFCEPQLCFQEVRRDSLSANPWKCPGILEIEGAVDTTPLATP